MDFTQTDPNLGEHVVWELLEARHVPPRLRVSDVDKSSHR